jgi:NADH-quinone oxidoreductase subunit G
MGALGRSEDARWGNLDEIDADLAQSLPVFKPVTEIAPAAGFRIAGQRIARESPRWSGRTANTAHLDVREPKPPEDPDSPLSYSMEGLSANPPKQAPAPLIPRFWAPGWNSVQAVTKFQEEINGPLRGGSPVGRLIEPGTGERPAYFSEIPQVFEARPGEWLAVPLYHVFGSEELSMLTPGVAERAPQPYLAVNPEDIAALTGTALPAAEPNPAAPHVPSARNPLPVVEEGELFELSVDGATYRLPARLSPAMPRGLVGVPAGLPGLPFAALPAWGRLAHIAEGGEG